MNADVLSKFVTFACSAPLVGHWPGGGGCPVASRTWLAPGDGPVHRRLRRVDTKVVCPHRHRDLRSLNWAIASCCLGTLAGSGFAPARRSGRAFLTLEPT